MKGMRQFQYESAVILSYNNILRARDQVSEGVLDPKIGEEAAGHTHEVVNPT
jgi:hypothetical protein